MGVKIGTKKPRQNLSATLGRDGRFMSTSIGWTFKGDKAPARAEAMSN
jgi:hypothetical protein